MTSATRNSRWIAPVVLLAAALVAGCSSTSTSTSSTTKPKATAEASTKSEAEQEREREQEAEREGGGRSPEQKDSEEAERERERERAKGPLGPTLPGSVHNDTSPPLRTIEPLVDEPGGGEVSNDRDEILPHPTGTPKDGAIQATTKAPTRNALINGSSILGIGKGFTGPAGTFSVSSAPPDTNSAIGPNHLVENVNSAFAIFNKSGTVLYGPAATNTLWSGFGGGCQSNNDGDGIVRYDRAADRWIISQFSVSTTPFLECIAVSTTGDPTGSYYRYAFQYADFPDYPKMGIWPDGYYVTYNMFNAAGTSYLGAKVCAMDRAKMLVGAAATQQCFNTSTTYGGLIASDVDSSTQPPAGAPNISFALGASNTTLAYWKFHVDWTTPANSTFTGPTALPVAAYTPACGTSGTCIPQSGGGSLDSLSDRLMNRLAYRNFGDHESMVFSHSVTAGSSVGVRWYEVRMSGGNPVIYQQSTYAPDSSYRWMGSAAMDRVGNIGLAYSLSSSSLKPSIVATGRLAGDPLNTMTQGETTLQAGIGAQGSSLTRWGDYASVTVDPTDDCTMWMSTEYLTANGTFNWSTRNASFQLPGCIPTAPGAPTIGTATAGNAQATLTWTAPASDGGSPITGYTVTPYVGATAQTPQAFNSTATTQTITGLTNGTTYTFKVAATNNVGTGSQSAASNAVTPVVPATAPGAPTIGTATAGNAQATLTWTAPASDGGSPITGYTVTPYVGATAQTPQAFNSTATTQTITGLTNGTTYTFKVAATNNVGTGSQSAASNAVTPATTPGAPTIGTATAGNAQATLTWTAPASDGGSPITGYTVTPYVGATAQTPQAFNSTATTQTITGLTNGTTYTFKVAATNNVGTGSQSAASNAVTPATTPGAPTIGTAVSSNGAAIVTWTAPANDGGSPITGYTVTPYVGATAQTPQTFNSTLTAQLVTGLTNGTTYTFTVAAINAVGTGPESDGSNAATPATTPDAPTIVTVTAEDEQVSLTWSAPANDGGSPITGYVVTPYIGADAQSDHTFNDTATTHHITGLTNGTTYTFTVAAINGVGTGAASTASSPVTPATTPGAPTIGTATPGNAQATLTWTAPATNGGAAVTGYVVTPYVGATAQATRTFNSTATTQTITGLTNGTTYTFTVAAKNSVGTGSSSAASNAVVPSGTWFLRNANSSGASIGGFNYGSPGYTPITGDWDGNGTTTIGVYRPSTGAFYLRNANSGGASIGGFTFGSPGDIPITGDWDGNGTTTIGIYVPATSTFYLRNANSSGASIGGFTFGSPGDIPITGDWDGNGTTTIGVYRPSTGAFYLRNANSSGASIGGFTFGTPGYTPITGDWDGNGTTTIGLYRPSTGTFYLRNANSSGASIGGFNFGGTGSTPVTGDWDGNGTTTIGTYR